MISLKNSIHIYGKVGDLVYYQLNGKEVSRRIGKISPSRYENDRSFSKMRANMSEFVAASMIGKVLRSGFTSYFKECGGPKDCELTAKRAKVFAKNAEGIMINALYLTPNTKHKTPKTKHKTPNI
jgi:hypothetical protein